MNNQFIAIGSQESLYGLAVTLKTEGISFLKKPSLKNQGISLIDIKAIAKEFMPPANSTLFITPSPQAQELAKKVFGVTLKNTLAAKKGTLKIKEGTIFAKTIETLHSFGFFEVLIPLNGLAEYDVDSNAEVLAQIEIEGKLYPAVIFKNGHFLFAFDLGKSLFSLLTETYFGRKEEKKPLSPIANLIYKTIPYSLRLSIYRTFLKGIKNRLAKVPYFTTKTPIDPAGWTLYQIFLNILDYSLDFLPRIWKWPNNYHYAFCFTHDIEPKKFAYYTGLPKLLDTLKELGLKSTVPIVADPPFPLPKNLIKQTAIEGHEVISHGLLHDGTFNILSSKERDSQIKESQKKLGGITKTEIKGFRAPWLQRTTDLAEVLESNNITFDSSFVDVDTSLKRAWHGKGISFNFPFNLFARNDEIKEYRVLELPLTGPQDMEPFFAGLSLEECKKVFERKYQWIKTINGLYVFLAHAGVYSKKDLSIRMELLRHLYNVVNKDEAWIAKMDEVANWWSKREGLRILPLKTSSGETIFKVENKNNQTVSNFSLVIPTRLKSKKIYLDQTEQKPVVEKEYYLLLVKSLKPGQSATVRLLEKKSESETDPCLSK